MAESRRIAVRNAADSTWRLKRPARQRHFFSIHAGRVFLGNDVPVRVDLGIPKNGGNPVLKTFGDKMCQTLGLLVHFVPIVHPMMSHQFPRPMFPGGGEPETSVLFMHEKSRPLRCKPLQHSDYRRRANPQPLFLSAAQFEC